MRGNLRCQYQSEYPADRGARESPRAKYAAAHRNSISDNYPDDSAGEGTCKNPGGAEEVPDDGAEKSSDSGKAADK